MDLIHQGMKGVVDEDGTAGSFFKNNDYVDLICGKTGTAQVTRIDLENNSWFVAFVPIEKPEIAIVSFIPNGWKGALSSMSASNFIEWYMKQKTLRTMDAPLPIGNTLAP
jgi:penicillin-binding protein 2